MQTMVLYTSGKENNTSVAQPSRQNDGHPRIPHPNLTDIESTLGSGQRRTEVHRNGIYHFREAILDFLGGSKCNK